LNSERVIPAEAGIQEDAICYAVSAKGASPHRMRPSKRLFSKESYSHPMSATSPGSTRETIHLILIGDELLSGQRRDLHLQKIAADLTARGARIETCEMIRDEEGAVEQCVVRYLTPGATIITTGGLGPTLDDLTREGISRATGVGLNEDPALWENLKERYQRMGRRLSESNRSQALIPNSGTFFPNAQGTAPGLVFAPPTVPGARVIALPGPPRELNPMWENQALPWLAAQCRWPLPPHSILMRFAQIGESNIDEAMRPILQSYPQVELSSLIRIGRVDVTLRLPADYPNGKAILGEIADRTGAQFKEYLYHRTERFGVEPQSPLDLEQVVLDLLRQRKETLALAESCTGGLLSSWITDYPGSSEVFLGGVVSYHNDLKAHLLQVPQVVLNTDGAVSESCVRAMAEGVRKTTHADWGIAISGVAGPGGGTPEKPVGLVYLAIAGAASTEAIRSELPGNRDAVRERAAVTALRQLWWKLVSDREG
jgi:nicotinamide-nucleotide amidase